MTEVALPSGSAAADVFARALAIWRGPEIQAVDGSLVAEDLRVLGQLLADGRARVLAAIDEAHPGRAVEQLSELEHEYGLRDGSGLPTEERQRRLLAKYRARQAGDLPSLQRTVRTFAAEAQLVALGRRVTAHTRARSVFRFVILLTDAHWSDSALRATLDALLQQQAPDHVEWVVAPGASDGEPMIRPFRCDDPNSRCDMHVLSI